MKQITEVTGEGLEMFLEKRVTLFCGNYIYTGTLIGVNGMYAKLANAAVVYETGAFDEKKRKDAQSLPHDWYVMLSFIESFGALK